MTLDARTQTILDLLNHDPLHAHDRERIVTAVAEVAAERDGIVNPNQVRHRLEDARGNLVVNPYVLSGIYKRLARYGYLEPCGTVRNDSRGNGNKTSTVWVVVRGLDGAA